MKKVVILLILLFLGFLSSPISSFAQTTELTPPSSLPNLSITPVQQNDIPNEETADSFFGPQPYALLSGENEPLPGDEDGEGVVKLLLFPAFGIICTQFGVNNIDPATNANLHKAPLKKAGPIALRLPTPSIYGLAFGCQKVETELLNDIKENASGYYINVYNKNYPNGAVRGQLTF